MCSHNASTVSAEMCADSSRANPLAASLVSPANSIRTARPGRATHRAHPPPMAPGRVPIAISSRSPLARPITSMIASSDSGSAHCASSRTSRTGGSVASTRSRSRWATVTGFTVSPSRRGEMSVPQRLTTPYGVTAPASMPSAQRTVKSGAALATSSSSSADFPIPAAPSTTSRLGSPARDRARTSTSAVRTKGSHWRWSTARLPWRSSAGTRSDHFSGAPPPEWSDERRSPPRPARCTRSVRDRGAGDRVGRRSG